MKKFRKVGLVTFIFLTLLLAACGDNSPSPQSLDTQTPSATQTAGSDRESSRADSGTVPTVTPTPTGKDITSLLTLCSIGDKAPDTDIEKRIKSGQHPSDCTLSGNIAIPQPRKPEVEIKFVAVNCYLSYTEKDAVPNFKNNGNLYRIYYVPDWEKVAEIGDFQVILVTTQPKALG